MSESAPLSVQAPQYLAPKNNKKKSYNVQCMHCPEAFDTGDNDDDTACSWHTGKQRVDKNSDVWYNYNPQARGPYSQWKDDTHYAAGFKWLCCKKSGDYGGCRQGIHQDEDGLWECSSDEEESGDEEAPGVVPAPLIEEPVKVPKLEPEEQFGIFATPPASIVQIKKEYSLDERANMPQTPAEQPVPEAPEPVFTNNWSATSVQCDRCPEEFQPDDNNDKEACNWHPGEKYANDDSDVWYDYDEDCNGPKEQHEGDYQYAAGFTWDCCGKSGAWDGCRQGRHKDEDDSDSDSEDDDEAEEKNVVVPPPVVAVSRVSPGKKRIAEEPLEQALEHHKVLKIATQAPEQSENPSIAEPSSMSQREQHLLATAPLWVQTAYAKLRMKYQEESYELFQEDSEIPTASAASAQLLRMKCHDCPAVLFSLGRGETLDRFESHLKGIQHRRSKLDKVNKQAHAQRSQNLQRSSTKRRPVKDAQAKDGCRADEAPYLEVNPNPHWEPWMARPYLQRKENPYPQIPFAPAALENRVEPLPTLKSSVSAEDDFEPRASSQRLVTPGNSAPPPNSRTNLLELGQIDLDAKPKFGQKRPDPPAWLIDSLFVLHSDYPEEGFEAIMHYVIANTQTNAIQMAPLLSRKGPLAPGMKWACVPRIRCLACPMKMHMSGPGETVEIFEAHLLSDLHRYRVSRG